MGPPRPAPAGLRLELLHGHGEAELCQAGDEVVVAVVPGNLQAQQLVLEGAFAWLQEIDQHVHGAAGWWQESRCPRPARCPLRQPSCGRPRCRPGGRGRSGRAPTGPPWRRARRPLRGCRSRQRPSNGYGGRSPGHGSPELGAFCRPSRRWWLDRVREWLGERSEGSVRRLWHLRPRAQRRPDRFRRAVRPPAPGAGVGRDGGERRLDDDGHEGHGPCHPGLQRLQDRQPRGPPGRWPHPLFDYGLLFVAQRPAHVPPGGRDRVRRSATTATSPTQRSWRPLWACCRGWSRATRT